MIKNFNKTIIVILIITTSCSWFNQIKSDEKTVESLEKLFKKDSENIDLTDFGDFEWDNIIIFGPYYQIEEVEEELDLDLSNIRENKIRHDDRINLIVFMNNGKSIKIAEISREFGGFKPEGALIKKENARFKKIDRLIVLVD
jgi:hypothetical protein